jgi:RimJ/RimL family protein N-acetyltransferase
MALLGGPAYRVETPRLRLRCFRPEDVHLVSAAIAQSLEHLRPWMTWTVHEPLSLEQRLEALRTRRGHFDLGSDYHYGIFDKAETRLLGSAGLTLRGEVEEREIGYWVAADQLGRGIATEVGSALVRVAFDIEGLASLEIRMEPHNVRSARVAAKLGFSGPTVDPLSHPTPEGDKRDMHVYGLSRVAYASSSARVFSLEAFDVLDRRIL